MFSVLLPFPNAWREPGLKLIEKQTQMKKDEGWLERGRVLRKSFAP